LIVTVEETEERIKKTDEKIAELQRKKSQVMRDINAEMRKQRTRRLIQAGAIVESVLKRHLEDSDLEKLQSFLLRQEYNGGYFSKAMNKSVETENSAEQRNGVNDGL
jgi:hypothetical protein